MTTAKTRRRPAKNAARSAPVSVGPRPLRATSLTAEGWYFLIVLSFVLAGGLVRGVNLLLGLFGLLLCAMLFNWRGVSKSLQGLVVRRRAPDSIQAGDSLVIDLELVNPRKRGEAWGIVIEDQVRLEEPGGGPPLPAKAFVSHLSPEESRTESYAGVLERRGRYRLGPLRLTTRFPLGMVRRTLTFLAERELFVWPRLGRLTHRWNDEREASDGASNRRRPLGLREGDYHGLRDFRAGDSIRWVHWRTSARRGELMVRQFEQYRSQDLSILVELRQSAHPSAEEAARLEQVVSLVATIVAERCQKGGCQLLLAVAGHESWVMQGPASMSLMNELMRRLAIVRAAPQADIAQIAPEALERLATGGDLLVICHAGGQGLRQRLSQVAVDARRQAALAQALVLDERDDLSQWFVLE